MTPGTIVAAEGARPGVERVIGFKRGTGGTSGVGGLRKMLDGVPFPRICKLRAALREGLDTMNEWHVPLTHRTASNPSRLLP